MRIAINVLLLSKYTDGLIAIRGLGRAVEQEC